MNHVAGPDRQPFDERRWFTWCCFAVLAIAHVVAFYRMSNGDGLLNSMAPPWEQNFDQARYWQSTIAFARGNLAASEHWYPPLYSLLMVPLSWLGETRDQLVVGLGLYLASFAAFSAIARHFAMRPVLALAFFAIGTLWIDGMHRAWAWPWNTSLSAALILWAMAMVLNLSSGPSNADANSPARWRLALLGALLAAIPCTRPVDGVVSAILGVFAAWHLVILRKDLNGLGAILAGGLAVLVPYGALYLAIWGPAPSEYARMSAQFGFDFAGIGWKAYLMLIEPNPWYPNSVGLLDRMPWLILSGAGLLAGLIAGKTRQKVAIVAMPMLAYCLPMICYRAIIPSGLWLYGNIHYFKWAWLIAILLAWQYVLRFRSAERLSLACLATLFALSCFSYVPVAAKPGEPARMLVYSARQRLSDNTIYMGETALVDRAGSQRNLFDLQATNAPDGLIYVLAQNRDFAGDERMVPDIPAPGTVRAADGIRVDGAKSAAAFGPLVGRFKPVLHYGMPCWLPIYRCPQSQLPPLPGARRTPG